MRTRPWLCSLSIGLASRLGLRVTLAVALTAGLTTPAWARSEKTLAYQRAEVWPAAVRFLVVDEHLKVTEKDAEAGYVLFELRDDGKLFRGSLEVMTVVRDGRSLVRFVVQIADRPSWLEIAMLTRLETKLRAELGSPAPPPSAPAPPPAKDEPKPDGPPQGGPSPRGDSVPCCAADVIDRSAIGSARAQARGAEVGRTAAGA
jgi:hypothetical protein